MPRRWRRPALGILAVGGPLLILLALTWPLLFSNSTFNEDWMNHLWYIWHQSRTIAANGLPSLFINYSHGIFYPVYAFYGGTLYTLGGLASLAFGTMRGYLLTYLLGFAAAYTGWYWMSRMFGLGRWVAHAPGIVFVTSAGYLMMIYGIGDWPEFLAISVMPLMIASGLAVLRAERLRFLPALALAASTIVFFGSHLLTAIWGSTILVIASLALLACVPAARRAVSRRGVLRVASIVIPSVLVSAWFLLPTAAYQSTTVVASSYPNFVRLLKEDMYVVAMRHLFTLSRSRASGTIVTSALPILAMAWVLLGAGIALLRRRGGTWMRVLLVLSAVATALVIMMTHSELILGLPRIYSTLQFSFRLESYVLLAISGAVLAVLALNKGGARAGTLWSWLLVPILAFSVVGGTQQAAGSLFGRSRKLALSSYLKPTFEQEGLLNYVDNHLKVVKTHLPHLRFPPESVHGDRTTISVHAAPGQLVDSNIRSGPQLLTIHGAKVVGVDLEADDVLEIGAGPGVIPRANASPEHTPPPTATISVSTGNSLPILAGRLLTGLAIATLAITLLWLAVQSMVARRRALPSDGVT
jgi:hypothetical protein